MTMGQLFKKFEQFAKIVHAYRARESRRRDKEL